MTTGTYAINGVDLTYQPTTGKWMIRDALGIAGSAQPMYPAIREFELTWSLISIDGFNQLQTFYNNASGVLSVMANLPIYNYPAFVFQNYSGCVIQEPSFGDEYYTDDGYVPNVRLVISNIRTT